MELSELTGVAEGLGALAITCAVLYLTVRSLRGSEANVQGWSLEDSLFIKLVLLYVGNPFILYAVGYKVFSLWANIPIAILHLALTVGSPVLTVAAWAATLSLNPLVGWLCTAPTALVLWRRNRGGSTGFVTLLSRSAAGEADKSVAVILPLSAAEKAILLSATSISVMLGRKFHPLDVVHGELHTVDASTSEPELSLYWYLFSIVFRRYAPYYIAIARFQPFVYCAPVCIRFWEAPLISWVLLSGLASVLDPTVAFTIQRCSICLVLAGAHTGIVSEMTRARTWAPLLGLTMVVSTALKYVWIHHMTSPNMIWIQQMLFVTSSGMLLADFGAAALKRLKEFRRQRR